MAVGTAVASASVVEMTVNVVVSVAVENIVVVVEEEELVVELVGIKVVELKVGEEPFAVWLYCKNGMGPHLSRAVLLAFETRPDCEM